MRQKLKWWRWWLRRDTRYREGTSFRLLKGAGLVSVDTDYGSFHFGVYPDHWVWGHEIDETDIMECLGLGPLILVAKLT